MPRGLPFLKGLDVDNHVCEWQAGHHWLPTQSAESDELVSVKKRTEDWHIPAVGEQWRATIDLAGNGFSWEDTVVSRGELSQIGRVDRKHLRHWASPGGV